MNLSAPQQRPRFITPERAFWIVFGLASLCSLIPLWRGRFLPLLDEPNHLSAIYIWHHFDDPAARLQEFYELNIQPVPYFAYYYLVHLIAYITGVPAANKVVLSAYILSLPTAAWLWTRRTQRSPWLCILAFPLGFSYSWCYGFHPFNIGLATFLFAILALDAFLEHPNPAKGFAFCALALACDLAHPLSLFLLYLSTLTLLLAHRPRWTRTLVTFALLAPSAALLGWQVFGVQTSFQGQQKLSTFQWKGQYLSPTEMIRLLPAYTVDSIAGNADLWVFGIVAATAFLLGIIGALQRKTTEGARPSFLLRHRTALLAALLVACYFLVPLHLQRPFDWWFVSGRFAPLICFFAFLIPTAELQTWKTRLLLLPACCAILFLPLQISEKYAAFNRGAQPFVQFLDKIPPGANILFLSMKPRTDPAVDIWVYNQFGAWVQLLKGGFSGSGWTTTGFPFTVKKSLPGPPWHDNERFNPTLHAGPYDFVIVRNERSPVFSALQPEWTRVAQEGAWTMYQKTGPSSLQP